jgi:hypothetical protein
MIPRIASYRRFALTHHLRIARRLKDHRDGPAPTTRTHEGATLALMIVVCSVKHGSNGMTINAYLPTSGASFSPESATNMGKALDGAVDILGIEPDDETKREAVARFIIKLAEIDGGVDEASLRDKAVMALSGSIHLASLSKDGQS